MRCVALLALSAAPILGCDGENDAHSPTATDHPTSTDRATDTGTGEPPITRLYEKYADYFAIGAAVDYESYISHGGILEEHFNSITTENEMKFDWLQGNEGTFTFGTPDRIVEFAEAGDMAVRGHALIWHRQTPPWVFRDSEGDPVTPEVLLERMERHITTVMTHYRGRVTAWDVVNEAIMNDGSLRTGDEGSDAQSSKWYAILGERYIAEAFRIAHAADPDAKLFYNDYFNYLPARRDAVFNLLEGLLADGVPVHGVGLQCHIKIEPSKDPNHHAWYQTADELETAIELYASLGLEIHVTEMDVSLYTYNIDFNEDNYYTLETFTDDIEAQQAERYAEFFEMFRRNSDAITSVTTWGVADDNTWLSELSSGRTDFPLLFDVDHQPKMAFDAIFDF